jgi:hypothetical protein
MVEMDADIGVPQWVFGQSRYSFLDGDAVDRVAFTAEALQTNGKHVVSDYPFPEKFGLLFINNLGLVYRGCPQLSICSYG